MKQFTNASKASKKSMESCINTTPNKKFTPTSSNKAQHKDWHCNSLVCMVSWTRLKRGGGIGRRRLYQHRISRNCLTKNSTPVGFVCGNLMQIRGNFERISLTICLFMVIICLWIKKPWGFITMKISVTTWDKMNLGILWEIFPKKSLHHPTKRYQWTTFRTKQTLLLPWKIKQNGW